MIKSQKHGFTLIELLAVIVILAIILAIAVPGISSTLKSTSKSAFQSNAKMILKAVENKKYENENFDVTSINIDNIDEILGLSNTDYRSINIETEGKNTVITVIGINKWNGLIACGTYKNMRVVESANDCSSDVTDPVITLLGDNPTSIYLGEFYTDAGATAIDNRDGNITGNILITSNINPSVIGSYTVTYMVTDMAGNIATARRTVNVIDSVKPDITIDPNGSTVLGKLESVKISATDFGGVDNNSLKYVWTDNTTEPSADLFTLSYINNQSIPGPSDVSGTYYLWVMASDVSGNRTVIMSNSFNLDNKAPVITMNGSNPYGLEVGGAYVDAGATAVDNIDENVAVVVTSDVNPSIIGTYTVTYTATDKVGNVATLSRVVKVVAPLTADSITAAIKNTNAPSGNYTITANGETYNIELIIINGDTSYVLADGATVNLGDNTADQRMLIVKYTGNLSVEAGVTVTSTVRKKGMLIYVAGTINNSGIISMSARGASAAGQNIYLWKNTDSTYEYVPAVGAAGAATTTSPSNAQRVAGKTGLAGNNRATGGGGSGGAYNNISGNSVSGAGGAGTSYSGGTGGGATASREVGTYTGYAGSSTGGAGGAGRSTKYSDSNGYNVGGGAGNPGGVGSGTVCCTHAPGDNGTGGLLIIYANNLNNSGIISSDGVSGGYGIGASGGSSGGGSINIFASSNYTNTGNIQALGGAAEYYGGAGGNGAVMVGYIYNNDFIPILPKIDFDITSGATYKPSYGVKITVSSPKIGIKVGTQKYVWTTSATAPTEDAITNSFVNGTTINTPSGVSGSYYLWVAVRDNKDTLNIEGAGPFNIDDIDPVITVTGSNPATMYTGEIYTDAGATATDNRNGTLAVTTTSNLNPSLAGSYTITYTATDSAGNVATATRTVNVLASITGDSILAAIGNTTIPDGDQKVVVNGVGYDAEVINVNGDTTYSVASGSVVSLGNTTADQRMLIIKYNGNLTIDAGVTLIATTRKKGMLVYVTGTLTNNGIISMSARGAIATGQNVYLWKNADGSYEYVPAAGGLGAVAVKGEVNGVVGGAGTSRATGGGGGGASMRAATRGGNGAAGTSYSGGSGGGGASSALDSPVTGSSATGNGGAGGAAVGRRTSSTMYVSSGGAGNPSGNDARPTAGANITVTGNAASSAVQGTGGLLIIYANTVNNNGTIEARGSASNFPAGYNTSVAASGGSSGGGSVNVFYNSINNVGTITAQGGQSGACAKMGGNGGDGSVTTTQINW
jgi:prepilin-type N-terminal cleavage/methylation domain-containing protein